MKITNHNIPPVDPTPRSHNNNEKLREWLKSKAEKQDTPPLPSKPHYESDPENLVTLEQAKDFVAQDFSKVEDIFNEPSHGLKQATRNVMRHVVAISELAEGKEVPDHEIDRKVIAHHVTEAKQTVYENLGRQYQAQSATQRLLQEREEKTEASADTPPTSEESEKPQATDFQKQSTALNILTTMMEDTLNLAEFKGQSPETGYGRF